jgi:hypothetical protein
MGRQATHEEQHQDYLHRRCADPAPQRMIQVHHPSRIHPVADPVPRLLTTVSSLTGGASRGVTSSSTQFTLLFCAQVKSEALGEVLVVDKDGANRVRRAQVPVHDHGAWPSRTWAERRICRPRASCLREPDVSDCGRRCIIISPNTSAAPSLWLLGLERHAPPHSHISLSTVMGRSWTPCMQLPCTCVLHAHAALQAVAWPVGLW